jgi:response regulator of citrate/malate metabolism
MKKINYEMPDAESLLSRVNEPEVMYLHNSTLNLFAVPNFISLSEKLLFTQVEWASVLHISDRTLQRYLKENKAFEGLFAEHLYQLDGRPWASGFWRCPGAG